MQIATSYFYKIRFFKPNMIPVSTCMSDPAWYRPPQDKEYYIDKRGVVCGLRYEPIIVQPKSPLAPCPCEFQGKGNPFCSFMTEYRRALYKEVDKETTLKAFEYCSNKFKKELGFEEEPIIVLIVYETPNNPCSERYALQEYFDCKELEI